VGAGLPFISISDRVVKAYRKHLFAKTTLQDLPDQPRFVINATNLESGVLMRFSKPYLADYRVGRINEPDLPLAVAVAASSAFPPVLSPCTVDLEHEDWITEDGNDLTGDEFRNEIRLSDGGVYDNLGLETAWKRYSTILVSDAGGHIEADADPSWDWVRQSVRILKVIDNQVRSLRKRQVIDSFKDKRRSGMYVGIRSHPADYPLPDPLPADPALTMELAATPTRLDAMDKTLQERLVNWGYVICDAGLRAYVLPGAAPGHLPYPESPISSEA
jgi:NTE family protein